MKENTLEYLYSIKATKTSDGIPKGSFHSLKDCINRINYRDYDWAEFGTGYAVSTRYLHRFSRKFPGINIHTFDWFKGLPEAWQFSDGEILTTDVPYDKGHLATPPNPILTEDNNIILYNGLFEDTVPEFAKKDIKLSFINMDADIYSSTKTVFDNINHMIPKGCIIHFDEYYNYDAEDRWKEHEYKAFMEWIDKYDRDFKYLGRGTGWQAWVEVTK